MADKGKQKDRDASDGQSGSEHSEQYGDARSAFEGLDVEEKAFFLVESAFNTVLDGLRQASDVARDAMEDAIEDLERRRRESEAKKNDGGTGQTADEEGDAEEGDAEEGDDHPS